MKRKRTPAGVIAAYILDLLDSDLWPKSNIANYQVLHLIERHCRADIGQKELALVLSDVGVRQTYRYDGYRHADVIAARPALERMRADHFADTRNHCLLYTSPSPRD